MNWPYSCNTFCSMECILILQIMGAKHSGHLIISLNCRRMNGFIYYFIYLKLLLNWEYNETITKILTMYLR
jgi:hypothetical protein